MESPRIEKEIWQRFKDEGIQVLGIDTFEEEDPMGNAHAFKEKGGLTFPVLVDYDSGVGLRFSPNEALPVHAVLDGDRRVRYLSVGSFDLEEIRSIVTELLVES